MQEAVWKDFERAFGVLQACLAIVAHLEQAWSKFKLHRIMKACIILHNMIVEDEIDLGEDVEYDQPKSHVEFSCSSAGNFSSFVKNYQKIQDKLSHHQLRNNLIQHLWALKRKSRE